MVFVIKCIKSSLHGKFMQHICIDLIATMGRKKILDTIRESQVTWLCLHYKSLDVVVRSLSNFDETKCLITSDTKLTVFFDILEESYFYRRTRYFFLRKILVLIQNPFQIFSCYWKKNFSTLHFIRLFDVSYGNN